MQIIDLDLPSVSAADKHQGQRQIGLPLFSRPQGSMNRPSRRIRGFHSNDVELPASIRRRDELAPVFPNDSVEFVSRQPGFRTLLDRTATVSADQPIDEGTHDRFQ